jgi:hypothetical protein
VATIHESALNNSKNDFCFELFRVISWIAFLLSSAISLLELFQQLVNGTSTSET